MKSLRRFVAGLTWKHARDPLLFLVGALGFFHELLSSRAERPTILLIAAGMMGAPVALRWDERDKTPPAPPPVPPTEPPTGSAPAPPSAADG